MSLLKKNEEKSLPKASNNQDGSVTLPKKITFGEWLSKIWKSIVKFANKAWKSFVRLTKDETFRYILKRTLSSIFTLLLIVAIVTALLRVIPDERLYDISAYNKLKGQNPTAAESFRKMTLFQYGRYDINGNKHSVFYSIFQYLYWLMPIPKSIPIVWTSDYSKVLEYHNAFIYLGHSKGYNMPVSNLLKDGIGISFSISMISVFFIYLFGYPLGIAMAKKPGGVVDKIGTIFIVLNYAIPALVFYLIMNKLMGNPNGFFGFLNAGYWYSTERPMSIFPPIFCIVFLSIPGTSMWVRRFTVDELNSDYVKFARAKGLSENRNMYTHVLRNSMVPLIRNIPATFIGAIIGSYFVETIWSIPGTGRLLTTALQSSTPDMPVIQGLTFVYAAMSMLSFLLGDIVTVFFDPRIRLTNKGI